MHMGQENKVCNCSCRKQFEPILFKLRLDHIDFNETCARCAALSSVLDSKATAVCCIYNPKSSVEIMTDINLGGIFTICSNICRLQQK